MTQDEMDRCIASVMRGLRDKKIRLACLRSKAEDAASCLEMVAEVLRGEAHGDFVDGVFYQRKAPLKTSQPTAEAPWAGAGRLEAVIVEIREIEGEICRLERRKAEMGLS